MRSSGRYKKKPWKQVEVKAEVVFHYVDVLQFQFRCSLNFFHYLVLGGWVVGKLESNAKLNSKLKQEISEE